MKRQRRGQRGDGGVGDDMASLQLSKQRQKDRYEDDNDDDDNVMVLLRQIADNTRRGKTGFQLVVSGADSKIVTIYDQPLKLNPHCQYELTLLNLETYYSFPNIDETNNQLRWRKTDVDEWKMVEIPIGCYEINAINREIVRQVGSKDIEVMPNLNTLKAVLIIKKTYEVDFNIAHSLRTVLGFDAKQYGHGRHSGEHGVNILRVNSILVHTDIITGSYQDGKMEPIIYSFFPDVSPGEKIVSVQHNLMWSPVTTNTIYRMTTWLTDQDNNKIDLRGETLTVRFYLQEC